VIAAGYKLPRPEWSGELRRCVQCQMLDAPVFSGEVDENQQPIFIHKVVIDLAFIGQRKVLTRQELALGFLYMKTGEDNCKVRTLCRQCLEDNEANAAVWLDFDKQRERDQDSEFGGDNYYLNLCK
jgi:hypothetical protein